MTHAESWIGRSFLVQSGSNYSIPAVSRPNPVKLAYSHHLCNVTLQVGDAM